MSRHLRRKHPHLYRAQEDTSLDSTDIDHLLMPRPPSAAVASAAVAGMSSVSNCAMPTRRSPFQHSRDSPAHNRQDEYRPPASALARSPINSDMYGRPDVPHSARFSAGPSRPPGAPHMPSESTYIAPHASQAENLRPNQHRPGSIVRNEQDAFGWAGFRSSALGSTETANRSHATRRQPGLESQMLRQEWIQCSDAQPGSLLAGRSVAPTAAHSRFPWDRPDEEMPRVPSPGMDDWPASGACEPSGSMLPQDAVRRGCFRTPSSQAAFEQAALPPGAPPMAEQPFGSGVRAATDLLRSEYFIDAMRPLGNEEYGFDSHSFIPQTSERVRVESGLGFSEPGLDGSLPGFDPQVSLSNPSVAAADANFDIDLSSMCDPTASVNPPSTGQLEQILTELGLDFTAGQGSVAESPRPSSSQALGAGSNLSAPPMIPSQDVARASWDPERLAPVIPNVHLHPSSQTGSSQGSFCLPSLTDSQAEYLGPNATSHRRPLDRSLSTGSSAFDLGSQGRAPAMRASSFAGALSESIPEAAETSDAGISPPEASSQSAVANFLKPHDSFRSRTATWDDEGDRKAAHADGAPRKQTRDQFPDAQQWDRSEEIGQAHGHQTEGNRMQDTDSNRGTQTWGSESGPMQCSPIATRPSTTMDGQADTEMEDNVASPNVQHRDSSASISTSAVGGDLLQLVVERFRAFAQLCQDYMHPSTTMVDNLGSSVPKVIRDIVPVFHPKMVCSQKIHSTEEALAILALTSTLSQDVTVKEEGYRLICFLYGVVVLSYKHSLHMGGKSSPILNSLLLIGKFGLRQSTPEFWLRFEESQAHILQDLLRIETRIDHRDDTVDHLDAQELKNMPEAELLSVWTRWYERESRKRTLLLCAISDSQASSYFSPSRISLEAHQESPRCQFLFGHVNEPCPDTLFFAWPPEEWAARLACSNSVPSSRCIGIVNRDGQPFPIAAFLAKRLLRPHTAPLDISAPCPRFRSSFDFGPRLPAAIKTKPMRPIGDPTNATVDSTNATPLVEIAEGSSESGCSSRRHSAVDGDPKERREQEPRTVSQLYMLALLESIHGAWMSDTGWYQTPAWGAAALPKQLAIDADDFDIDSSTLADLPGWRIGRKLRATQVAHALMNWSEMFSGWNDVHQMRTGGIFLRSGLSLSEDAQQATIRWQAIFLDLCVPLPTLCFYLQDAASFNAKNRKRHDRISLLLGKWAESSHCRRALVHASTILTMWCGSERLSAHGMLRPTTAHAVFMSLVVLVSAHKLLAENLGRDPSASGHVAQLLELVPVRQVWPQLLHSAEERDASCSGGEHREAVSDHWEECEEEDPSNWLYVHYWHWRFVHLGLAGIFDETTDGSFGVYADWRASVSSGTNGGGPLGPGRSAANTRPRWSSFVGDSRWPAQMRTNPSGQASDASNKRRASHAQFVRPPPQPVRSLLRWRLRGCAAGCDLKQTRRWILLGSTHDATICGFALSHSSTEGPDKGTEEEHDVPVERLSRDHLRELVNLIQTEQPMWCFSSEFASLLLRALESGDTES